MQRGVGTHFEMWLQPHPWGCFLVLSRASLKTLQVCYIEKQQAAPSLSNPSCLHRAEHSMASTGPQPAEDPASKASRDQPTQMFAENMDYSWVLLLECYLNLISQTFDKEELIAFLGWFIPVSLLSAQFLFFFLNISWYPCPMHQG